MQGSQRTEMTRICELLNLVLPARRWQPFKQATLNVLCWLMKQNNVIVVVKCLLAFVDICDKFQNKSVDLS